MRRFAIALVIALGLAFALGGRTTLRATGPTTVVVGPGNLVTDTSPTGWYFWNDKDDLPTGSPGALVAGAGTPPLGSGSVELGPLTDGGATAGGYSVIATNAYFGTPLANITSLSYSSYQPGPTLAVSLQFDVKYRTTDTAYGGRLVFEPYQNGTVTVGSGWQTWSPLSGVWWASKTNADGTGGAQVVALPTGNCAISTPCTWSQIMAAFPDAQVYGRFLLRAGSGAGWTGFDGNADDLVVGISSSETEYNFEGECTTDCYVRSDGNDANPGTADTPGAAKQTVQAAVDAVSPGGTVHVGAGTYVEQVEISKALTLDGAGEGSTTIQSPASLPAGFTTSHANKPVVYVHDATGVAISHLTVDGDGQGNANYAFEGIAYHDAGGSVASTTIVHVRETPLNGNQHGVALYAYNDDAVARTLEVTDNTISDYQKNGMALNGDGLTVTVSGNNVTGAGATNLTAQNGIQIGYGAGGSITSNVVSDNYCTVIADCVADPTSDINADGAAGILLYEPGTSTITVDGNTLTDNQFGIWTVGATDLSITNNGISGATGNGIAIWSNDQWCGCTDVGTTGSISGNTIAGLTYGIIQRDYTSGAPVPAVAAHDNSITGAATDGAWSNVAMDATDNWWGSANGPEHVSNTFNVGSQGAAVSDNVSFVPWLDAAPPIGVSFAPVTDTSPVGSYSSIQAGIDASNPGGGVNAKAGTFTENVTATKSVTVAGAGEASTTIVPAVSLPNPCAGSSLCGSATAASNIFLVQADDVTLQDMTLDGDNPSLTSGIVAGGADLDARNGIVDNYYAGVFDNIHVHDVTVKNIYLRGIYAASGGSGFDFHDDTVENVQADPSSIAMFNYGGSGVFANNTVSDANDGISANHSRGTQFLNNVITASASGVHTDNSGDGGGSGDVIDGNSVSDCTTGGYGVWTFVPYIQPTVQNNVVTNCAVGLAATGSYVAVGTLFENNEVDGLNAAGSTGVYITTSTFYFASGNVEATLTGNIIKNNEDGFVFQSESGFTLTVDNLGNSITGNTTGTDTDGTGTYDVKMLGDWWGSASGPTNASNPSGTGDSVSDGIPFSPWLGIGTDSSGATGFQMASPMTWVAGPALCDGTCIQKAVDLASSGDTISALAGTFDEQVRDSGKSNLLINGAGVGSTVVQPSGVVANTTRINTNPAAVIFDVEDATGVTIQNLTADGSLNGLTGCTPDFLGFYYKNASGDLKHVAADHIKLAPALLGCQTGNGVYVESENPGFGAVNVNDASVTDYQKGGIVGNRVETALSVTNSVITGIGPTDKIAQNGIQVGFSAQGVLTGNDISGNDYTPSTYASTAILLYQATGATVTDNNMHDNQEGLFVQSTDGATVSANQFTNTRDTATFVYLSNNGTYDHNTFTGMAGSYGMYFYDASTNNAVHDNALRFNDHGVLVDYSGSGAPTGNTFNMNCIADNAVDGMATLGTVLTPVDATNNWWGKINGANPPGHGDNIDPAATINATPFLTAPVAGCPVPADGDGDGFVDASDNCPTVYNPDQANSDAFNYAANLPGTDSRGDVCDVNISGDGYLDATKTSLGKNVNLYCATMRADIDGDGTVSVLDLSREAAVFLSPVPSLDPTNGLDTGIQRVNQNGDAMINILDLSVTAYYYHDQVTACP